MHKKFYTDLKANYHRTIRTNERVIVQEQNTLKRLTDELFICHNAMHIAKENVKELNKQIKILNAGKTKKLFISVIEKLKQIF